MDNPDNTKKENTDISFLDKLKPELYRDELIKFKAINTSLNEKVNENEGTIKNLQQTIAEKDVAFREVSRSFEIEKEVNERMKNIVEHSTTITKKEISDDENYEKAMEELANYNRSENKEK